MRNLFPMNSVTSLGTSDTANLSTIVKNITTVISSAIGIVTAGIVILAIFIAFKFFTAEDDGKRKNAKAQLIYAIIGIVVLIALLIFIPSIKNAITGALAK